jgi:hypothetical protein
MLEFNQCNLFTGAPAYDPILVVTPEPNRTYQAYAEDTVIKAMCTVKDARPAASISWFIGEFLFQPLQYK